MIKRILIALSVVVSIFIIFGIIAVSSLIKYHNENTFADIEVVTKGRSLDPYEETYHEETFSDTCIKGSVIELNSPDYTVTVVKVYDDGRVDFKVHSNGGLWTEDAEYGNKDIITLNSGEEIILNEMVMDMEFIIEVKILNVYYR